VDAGQGTMAISFDILTLQPIAAAPAPAAVARQPQVAAVGERDGAKERRGSAGDERARPNVAFRSFLNAATLAGLTQTLGKEASRAADATPAETRPVKLPKRDATTVLSGTESDRLLQSVRSTLTDKSSAPQYLAATTRYAKSYFAVSGTFAKPGESLELTA